MKLLKLYRYQLIEQYKDYGICHMCGLLHISRAAYYQWRNQKETARQRENNRILERIQSAKESNHSLFGVLSMTDYLNMHKEDEEIKINHKRVYRLMAIHNIRSHRPRYRKSTYRPCQPEETAENLLKREFDAQRPDEKWCGDITQDRYYSEETQRMETVFISSILDLYDRYPVSVKVSKRNDVLLVNQTLEKAIADNPDVHPVFHSDRGFQ